MSGQQQATRYYGTKKAGRGTGNFRRFNVKQNATLERGLVEELPLLRYSSKVEDQMPVNFINWKEKIFQYVQNNGNYSPNVAKILKGENVQPENIPPPPRPGVQPQVQAGVQTRGQAQAQALAQAQQLIRADPDVVEWWEKDQWKDDCKRVKDRNEKLEIDKKKLYALLLGQMTDGVKQKLQALAQWTAVSQSEDPGQMLNLINMVCMTPGSYSQEERMHAARTNYHTLKQWKTESLGDFRKRFDAAIETLRQSGVPDNQLPSDAIKTVDFANALDKTRFGQFIVDYRNGLLTGLDSVNKVQARAECYVTLRSEQSEKSGQIFLCSDTPKQGGNPENSSKKKPNKPGGQAKNQGNGSNNRNKSKSNGKRPSNENRCFTCDSTEHFARDCPNKRDTEDQKLTRGNTFVTMASMIIPSDNMDHHDNLDQLHDETSLTTAENIMLNLQEKVVLKSEIMVAAESLPDHYILLDTCGSANIFSSTKLMKNIRTASYGLVIDGIKKGSKPITTYEHGDTKFGEAHYSPDVRGNILSFAVTRDKCFDLHYDFATDRHLICMTEGGDYYVFVRWNNIYVHDTRDHSHMIEYDICFAYCVKEKMAEYTKREVKDAAAARELMRKLADPSPSSVAERLRTGRISHTSLTPEDVWRSINIWGKSPETIKGKTTSHQAPIVKVERLPVEHLQKRQELQVDLMFIDKVAFLLGVLLPMKYIFVSPLVNKTKTVIWKSLRKFIAIPRSRNIEVDAIRTDPESAIVSLETEIAESGCTLNPGGTGEAVPVVERTIRTIKERCRGIINTLPYTLPYCLIAALCIFVVQRLNMFPSSTSNSIYSPREQLWNRVINAKTDLALGFGDYVQAHRNLEDNSMNPRTDGAIALYPIGNLEGTWAFFNLNTNRVIKRNRWTNVPLDQRVIEFMNGLSLNQKRHIPHDITFYRGEYPVNDEEEREVLNEYNLDDQDISTVTIRRAEDVVEAIPMEFEIEDTIGPTDPQRYSNNHVVRQIDQDTASIESPTIIPPELSQTNDASSLGEVAHVSRSSYNLRPNRARPGRWTNLLADSRRVYGLHFSTKAAIKKFGQEATSAMIKEMSQIVEKGTIRPIKLDTVRKNGKKPKVIRSHMFFKEKFHPNGDFDKLKARFVAGGDGQDRTLYSESEITSKTVSTSSVFIIAAVAAMESRAVATIDFPGAYLNSDMPTDGEPVYMSLDQYMTKVLIHLKPEYSQFLNVDGTCTVQVMKGLYGLIEAAKLWYDKITGTLKTLGFQQNPYDSCVFNREEANGKQTTVAIHVDDMFISASDEGAISKLISDLETYYPGLSVNRGKELNYLGMVFKFTKDNKVIISMDGFVNDLLSHCDIQGTANTPATSSLFSVDDKAKMLSEEKKSLFHSITAKLLYFSKRIRPDLLVAVSFLTTRVQNPTEEDWLKLCRAIKYVRATKNYSLTLDANKFLTVIVFVDASFAVHPNYRSHTGAAVTLFQGVLWAKSSKQKLTTKSSTEAELVAISDIIGQVMWMTNFLEAQGYKLPPPKMFEDNLSTIALIKNGKSNSNRTRHIAIRYFFIAEKVANKEIDIEYKPTDDMLADILTKPLQGERFKRLRNQLLNIQT